MGDDAPREAMGGLQWRAERQGRRTALSVKKGRLKLPPPTGAVCQIQANQSTELSQHHDTLPEASTEEGSVVIGK